MNFHKEGIHPSTNSSSYQIRHKLSVASRAGSRTTWQLYAMSTIKNYRVAKGTHNREGTHIHNQIIVTEGSTTLCKKNLRAAPLMELVYHIPHISRGHKLAFLYINHSTTLSCCVKKVGLTAKKSRNLNNICYLGYRINLLLSMYICDNWYLQFILNGLQHFQAIFQAWTTEAIKGGTIGLIKGSLEYIRNTQTPSNFFDSSANQQTSVQALQNTGACQKGQRLSITY